MKSVVVCASCLLLGTLAAPAVSAQDREIVRISANVGLQEGPGKLSIDVPLTAPGGSGSFVIDDSLANSAFVDVSGSLRVWKGVALGAGFSKTNTENLSHQYEASVPPAVPGRLNLPINDVVAGMVHGESAVYALASWTTAVSNRFDVVLSGGPMFFDVEQDLPNVTVIPTPNGGQTLLVSKTRLSESATGVHVGLDLDYTFNHRAGAGILLRYSRGAIDVPNGTDSMTVGGFQAAVGFRLKL